MWAQVVGAIVGGVDIVVGKQRPDGIEGLTVEIESGLDDAFAGRVEQDARVGPLAQQQRERPQEDGFAGTRLASDGDKTAVELDVRQAYQGIVFDM